MTREEVHDLMKNELRCVQRGNYCDRDCAKCFLVKDDKETIETCAVIAFGVFLFLVFIMFIVLFK